MASGFAAHATGVHSTASGDCSFTLGQQTKAEHSSSVACGVGTETYNMNQVVIGKYNKKLLSPIFIVGNGDDASHRHNAFSVE